MNFGGIYLVHYNVPCYFVFMIDHERITTLNRKFKKEELLDMDFQAYLASSSEDEEEIEEEQKGTVNLWCSTFVSIQIPK